MNPENPRASVDVTDLMPTPIDVTDRLTEDAKAEIMARQETNSGMMDAAADSATKAAAAREIIEGAAPTGPIIEAMPEELAPAPAAPAAPAPEIITQIPDNLV